VIVVVVLVLISAVFNVALLVSLVTANILIEREIRELRGGR
jgi:hypothetical protein